MKKKLISAFLAVMMIMSFMAVTAMATDNPMITSAEFNFTIEPGMKVSEVKESISATFKKDTQSVNGTFEGLVFDEGDNDISESDDTVIKPYTQYNFGILFQLEDGYRLPHYFQDDLDDLTVKVNGTEYQKPESGDYYGDPFNGDAVTLSTNIPDHQNVEDLNTTPPNSIVKISYNKSSLSFTNFKKLTDNDTAIDIEDGIDVAKACNLIISYPLNEKNIPLDTGDIAVDANDVTYVFAETEDGKYYTFTASIESIETICYTASGENEECTVDDFLAANTKTLDELKEIENDVVLFCHVPTSAENEEEPTPDTDGGFLEKIIKTIFGFKSIQMFSLGVFLSKLVELILDIFR